jgi:hypothetical protein
MPQIWLRPFMARNVVEDGDRVKASGGAAPDHQAATALRTGAGRPSFAIVPPSEVSESLTPPLHSSASS